MLATIVVLFVICWGPSLIDNVLVAFSVVERYHYDHLKYMRQAFSLMAYFNSCVNPIVYAFMSKSFRQGFRRTACGCTEKPFHRTPTMSNRTPQTQWTTAAPHRPAAVPYSASFPQALDLIPHSQPQPSA
ncbi:hypothetical protein NP493_232g03007 [Ridgeia piscesae]|uniref:G-protein coupled receptors family 1 profile domain-containing protein n=1 Tax=Ridgeia piscesae TaxID=27915 RepID=A0AAD9P000_RIDPI|nr:hypothetical protein NP493_232g03007 [Ridgeia piscesae]